MGAIEVSARDRGGMGDIRADDRTDRRKSVGRWTRVAEDIAADDAEQTWELAGVENRQFDRRRALGFRIKSAI